MNEERIRELADRVAEGAYNLGARINVRTMPHPWLNWGIKCATFVGVGVPICALGMLATVVDSMPRGRGN